MKNLINNFFKTLYLVLLSFSFSCSEQFLDVDPIGVLSERNLATHSGVNGLLIGAYSLLDNNGGWQGAGFFKPASNAIFGGYASDDAFAGTFGNLPDSEQFETWKHTPTNPVLGFKWGELYAGVQRSNDVLRVLNLVPQGNIPEIDAIQIKAEATFLRAYYHFELAKIWENVPYLNEEISFQNGNYNVSNSTSVWPKIESDFQFAIDNLTSIKPQVGRANKWAAKAFLAKSYMFQHKFSEAKPLLEDIIANGVTAIGLKYELVNYADNFNPSKQNNAEIIFSVQNSVNDGANGANGNIGDVINIPLVPGAGGSGAYMPSFSLVNSYKTDPNTGLPLIYTFNEYDVKHDLGLASTDPFTPYEGTLDSRLDWTAARRGIPLMDHGIFGRFWILFQNIGGPYANKKNFFYNADRATTTESIGWSLATANNVNLIRFADVLLWAAEVEVEIGSLIQAENYVNLVRARAADPSGWVKTYIDNENPGSGFTDTPAANYKVGLYNGQFQQNGKEFSRDAVRFERKIELAMEGHRFFDLRRYDNGSGYMAEVLNAYLSHEKNVPGFTYSNAIGAKFIRGKNELYPIPQSEIDVSIDNGSSVLIQNPGY